MSKCDKLLRHARQAPKGVRFEELCTLAECYGFVFARQEGSHRIYKHPTFRGIMDFQNNNGQAKPSQVRQLLEAIEAGVGQASEGDTDDESDT
jgi:predicted RNA binding protein YcfA (HicA-like mRNA interferase family)